MATKAELEKHLDDPRVQAFLAMIRDAEGTSKGADPYRVYGGSSSTILARTHQHFTTLTYHL